MAEQYYNLLKKHKINKTHKFLIKSPESHISGPFFAEEIATLIKEGEITEEHNISSYPSEKWQNIVTHPFFYDLILHILAEGHIPQRRKKEETSKVIKKTGRVDQTEKLKPISAVGGKTVLKRIETELPPAKKTKLELVKKTKKKFLTLKKAALVVTALILFTLYFFLPKTDKKALITITLPPTQVETVNSEEALKEFENGKKFFALDTFLAYKKALDHFHKSLTHDPNQAKNALSYLTLTYLELWSVTSGDKDEQKKLLELIKRIQAGGGEDFLEYYIASGEFEFEVTQDIGSSQQFLKQGLARFPDNPQLLYLLGKLNLHEGDNIEALENLNKAIQLDPTYIKPYFEKAAVYLKNNNAPQAEGIFETALSLLPSHIPTQLELTILQYTLHRNITTAQDNLKNIISSKREDLFPVQRARAYFYMGKISQEIKSFDVAVENFRLAQENDPENELYREAYKALTAGGTISLPGDHKQDISFFINLGQIHLKQKEYNTALEKFKIATALDPENYEPWFYIGQTYFEMGMQYHSEALEALEKSIQARRDYAPSYLLAAELYLEQKNFKKSKEMLKSAEKMSPHDAQFHFISAQYFKNTNQFERAIDGFQKALSINNSSILILLNLSQALIEKEEYTKADIYLKKVLEMQNANEEAHNLRAEAKLRDGYPQSAIEYLEALLKKSPTNASYHAGLAKLYLLSDKSDLAEKECFQAIQNNPKLVETFKVLSQIYLKKGEPKESVAVYRHLRALSPYEVSYYYDAAKLSVDVGEKHIQNTICGDFRTQCERNKIQYPQDLCVSLIKKCQGEENLKSVSLAQQFFKEASELLEKITGTQIKKGLNANYPLAYYLKGKLYSTLGDTNSAIKAYLEEIRVAEAMEHTTDLSLVYLELANTYYYANRYAEAIPYFEKSIKANQNVNEAYLKLGISYFFLNKLANAESYLDVANKRYGYEESQVHFFLAQIYKKEGSKDRAIETLKKYLRTDPLTPLKNSIAEEIHDLEKL